MYQYAPDTEIGSPIHEINIWINGNYPIFGKKNANHRQYNEDKMKHQSALNHVLYNSVESIQHE